MTRQSIPRYGVSVGVKEVAKNFKNMEAYVNNGKYKIVLTQGGFETVNNSQNVEPRWVGILAQKILDIFRRAQ